MTQKKEQCLLLHFLMAGRLYISYLIWLSNTISIQEFNSVYFNVLISGKLIIFEQRQWNLSGWLLS